MKNSFLIILVASYLFSCSQSPANLSGMDSIVDFRNEQSLKTFVDGLAQPLIKDNVNTGIIVGVITPQGDHIYSYGYADKEKKWDV